MKISKVIWFAGLLLSILLIQSCCEDKIYGEPTQLITHDFAKQLHTNYNGQMTKRSVSDSIVEDANAVWYSIEELERYIYYVKTQGEAKGYAVDGVRLYLGKYPNNPNEHQEKAGMTTVFLSPTGRKNETQKGGILNISTNFDDTHPDITEISPLNYGSMGNPPKVTYPLQ